VDFLIDKEDDPEVREWVKGVRNRVMSTHGLHVSDKVVYQIIYEFNKVLKEKYWKQ